MNITDYNPDHKECWIEIDDRQECTIQNANFFDFVCESQEWFNDPVTGQVSIPVYALSHDEERDEYHEIPNRCQTFTYEKFLRDATQPVKQLLESYLLSADIKLYDKEYIQDIDDSDEEAYQDFRRAQAL